MDHPGGKGWRFLLELLPAEYGRCLSPHGLKPLAAVSDREPQKFLPS